MTLRRLAAGNARASPQVLVIGYGDPWRAILEAANRLDVDLVVVGSHLYHFPDEELLGTVAGTLANRGTRNVLVVHSTARRQASEGPGKGDGHEAAKGR